LSDRIELAPRRDRITVEVTNTSARIVRVSSHYPFWRTNRRLRFDREAARGFRLDVPAGSSIRFAPGETREVTLVRYGGLGGTDG
jgi:urease beta subunit